MAGFVRGHRVGGGGRRRQLRQSRRTHRPHGFRRDRAVNRLETRLGVRLLDRTTRSVALTDEGRRFYDEVKPHLNAIEDAATIASGAVSAVRGRLKVDIDPFFLPMVLAGRLGASASAIPNSLSSSYRTSVSAI